jgi:hypothetical protein
VAAEGTGQYRPLHRRRDCCLRENLSLLGVASKDFADALTSKHTWPIVDEARSRPQRTRHGGEEGTGEVRRRLAKLETPAWAAAGRDEPRLFAGPTWFGLAAAVGATASAGTRRQSASAGR